MRILLSTLLLLGCASPRSEQADVLLWDARGGAVLVPAASARGLRVGATVRVTLAGGRAVVQADADGGYLVTAIDQVRPDGTCRVACSRRPLP